MSQPNTPIAYTVINDWGDSISQGREDGTDTTICSVLHSLSGLPCNNYGIGGQTSSGIAARMGAVRVSVRVAGGMIPEDGDVAVEFSPANYAPAMPNRPRLMVKGAILADDGTEIMGNTHCPSGMCFFTRLQPGERKHATGARPWMSGYSRQGLNIIEACTNNPLKTEICLRDVAAMVASIPPGSSYVVLPPFLGDNPRQWRGGDVWNAVQSITREEARLYPNHFINVREQLVQLHPPGNDGDFEHDITPASYRAVLQTGSLLAPVAASGCNISTADVRCVKFNSYLIDSEAIYVNSCDGEQVGECTRGWNGSQPAAHVAGAEVKRLDWLHPNGAGLTFIAEQIWKSMRPGAN